MTSAHEEWLRLAKEEIANAQTEERRKVLKWLYHPILYGMGEPRMFARGGNPLLNREELRRRNGE